MRSYFEKKSINTEFSVNLNFDSNSETFISDLESSIVKKYFQAEEVHQPCIFACEEGSLPHNRQSMLQTAPNFLCITFKDYPPSQGSQEASKPLLQFPNHINISGYVKDQQHAGYYLKSCLKRGACKSNASHPGHYVAYIKQGDTWHQRNDISSQEIGKLDFNTHTEGSVYALFYQKKVDFKTKSYKQNFYNRIASWITCKIDMIKAWAQKSSSL